jgi:transcriptional regulator with XRE-family HTH domain
MRESPDLIELGETLRERREVRAAEDRRAFSVRSLAARLGVSATYLSGLERGQQRPTEVLLRHLARELAIEPEPLLALPIHRAALAGPFTG